MRPMMRQFYGSWCNWQTYAGVAELAGVVGVPCYILGTTPLLANCALCVSVQAMHSNEAASLSNQWIVQGFHCSALSGDML